MDIMSYFKTMKDVLLKPRETIKKNKKLGLGEGLVYAGLSGLVVGIIMAILTAWATLGLGFMAIITIPIGSIIGLFVGGVIFWIIAMIFGCKKEVGNFIGVLGLVYGSVMLVSWIPVIGWIASLYGIYLAYVMLTEAMDMKSTNAIITIIIPIIIAAVLAFVLAAFLIMLLGTLGMGTYATTMGMGL